MCVQRHEVCVCVCVCVQSCRLFCDHVDYIPTGSSVHGISQARILERVAIAYSRGSPWPKAQTHVFCLTSIFFTKATSEKPLVYVIGLLKLLNLRHQAFYVFHLLSVIHFLPSYHHFPTPKALFHFFATSTQILMIHHFAHVPKFSGWLRLRHCCPEGIGTWVLHIDFQINEIIVQLSISQSQNSHKQYVEAICPEA